MARLNQSFHVGTVFLLAFVNADHEGRGAGIIGIETPCLFGGGFRNAKIVSEDYPAVLGHLVGITAAPGKPGFFIVSLCLQKPDSFFIRPILEKEVLHGGIKFIILFLVLVDHAKHGTAGIIDF
jgi:hypothetical protein